MKTLDCLLVTVQSCTPIGLHLHLTCICLHVSKDNCEPISEKAKLMNEKVLRRDELEVV